MQINNPGASNIVVKVKSHSQKVPVTSSMFPTEKIDKVSLLDYSKNQDQIYTAIYTSEDHDPGNVLETALNTYLSSTEFYQLHSDFYLLKALISAEQYNNFKNYIKDKAFSQFKQLNRVMVDRSQFCKVIDGILSNAKEDEFNQKAVEEVLFDPYLEKYLLPIYKSLLCKVHSKQSSGKVIFVIGDFLARLLRQHSFDRFLNKQLFKKLYEIQNIADLIDDTKKLQKVLSNAHSVNINNIVGLLGFIGVIYLWIDSFYNYIARNDNNYANIFFKTTLVNVGTLPLLLLLYKCSRVVQSKESFSRKVLSGYGIDDLDNGTHEFENQFQNLTNIKEFDQAIVSFIKNYFILPKIELTFTVKTPLNIKPVIYSGNESKISVSSAEGKERDKEKSKRLLRNTKLSSRGGGKDNTLTVNLAKVLKSDTPSAKNIIIPAGYKYGKYPSTTILLDVNKNKNLKLLKNNKNNSQYYVYWDDGLLPGDRNELIRELRNTFQEAEEEAPIIGSSGIKPLFPKLFIKEKKLICTHAIKPYGSVSRIYGFPINITTCPCPIVIFCEFDPTGRLTH